MMDNLLFFHIVNGFMLIFAANACANLPHFDNLGVKIVLSACGFAFLIVGVGLVITAPFAGRP
jgi:hypothetical protein